MSAYNYFAGAHALQQPASGVIPFDVNAALFADGAGKLRFLVLPPGGKIAFDPTGRWQFPDGTVLIKTFYFDRDARTPSAGRRLLETRLEVFRDGEWTLYTYLWDDAQTEATRLVPGRTLAVTHIDASGQTVALDYRVPSSDQCKTCHAQDRVSVPLGPRTRQLNRTFDYGPGLENQLDHLAALGAFDRPLPPVATLDRLADPSGTDPLETRARSYLDANCAHCHSAGGAASSTSLRLNRETTLLIDLGICRSPNAAGPGAGQLLYDIVPGKPDEIDRAVSHALDGARNQDAAAPVDHRRHRRRRSDRRLDRHAPRQLSVTISARRAGSRGARRGRAPSPSPPPPPRARAESAAPRRQTAARPPPAAPETDPPPSAHPRRQTRRAAMLARDLAQQPFERFHPLLIEMVP